MSAATSELHVPDRSKANLYEQVCEIYKLYRILRMNTLYYAKLVNIIQNRSFWFDILVAISSSATVASVESLSHVCPTSPVSLQY